MAITTLPSIDYLRECFDCDAAAGVLTWRNRPRSHFSRNSAHALANRYAGLPAGTNSGHGYLNLKLDGKLFRVHRIIYKMATGLEPPPIIDHINGNGRDNRLANLRPATQAQSMYNRRVQYRNIAGLKGTQRVLKRGKTRWIATFNSNGVRHYLGTFTTAEEAHLAFCAAAKKEHGEFFNPGYGTE